MPHDCPTYNSDNFRRAAPERWQFFFYRTQSGAEADLVMQSPRGNLYLIELKLSLSAGISRGFYQSGHDLAAKGKFVVVLEGESFPKADGTWVCSLQNFLQHYFPELE